MLSDPKFIILVNVNSSLDIGDSAFSRVDNNIGLLIERGMKRNITLGINVYKENQDFSDFLSLVKKYGFTKIRLSVVIPHDKSEGGIDYFYMPCFTARCRFCHVLYILKVLTPLA